jgi:hypothetical protein
MASRSPTPTAITQQDGLFQSIALPAGTSRVTFSYAPPHILPGWRAFWLALALSLLQAVLCLLPGIYRRWMATDEQWE